MWKWLKNLFKKKPVIEHDRPKLPTTDEYQRENIDLIIAIAGHEEGGGMTIYTGESENDHNAALVERIDKTMRYEKDVYVLSRKYASYSKYLRAIKKDIKRVSKESGVPLDRILVLEFHKNDAGRSARGVEYLVMDNASTAILRPMVERFSAKFGIKLRRDGGIYRIYKGNGTGFLRVCNGLGCKSGIIEECFAGTETEESKQFYNNREEGLNNLTGFYVGEFRDILDA